MLSCCTDSRDAGELTDGYDEPGPVPHGLSLIPRQLAGGVHALLATIPPRCNSGLIAGDRAAMMVDAGETPRVSRMIQDLSASLTGTPVKYVVNTTHRSDHTSGNSSFPSGVKVVASARATAAMSSLRLPDVTFESSLEIDLGGVAVQLWHFGQGSSPGDSVVYVPHARAAWTGDFLNHAGLPPVRLDGCPLAHAASLRSMRDLLPELQTVVPGHGPAGDAQEAISWMIAYLGGLHGHVKALRDCGASLREAVAVCMFSSSWSAPPSLPAAAANYPFTEPGGAQSRLAGLAASLHRANIAAAYRSLGGLPLGGERFHGQLVVLPDHATRPEQKEDPGCPGDVPAGSGQLDREGDDVAVPGYVPGGRDSVIAAGDELLVGLAYASIEPVVPAELDAAVDELDSVRCPQAGDGGAPRGGIGFAPHGHVPVRDLVGHQFFRFRHDLAPLPSASECFRKRLNPPVTGGSSHRRGLIDVRHPHQVPPAGAGGRRRRGARPAAAQQNDDEQQGRRVEDRRKAERAGHAVRERVLLERRRGLARHRVSQRGPVGGTEDRDEHRQAQ